MRLGVHAAVSRGEREVDAGVLLTTDRGLSRLRIWILNFGCDGMESGETRGLGFVED